MGDWGGQQGGGYQQGGGGGGWGGGGGYQQGGGGGSFGGSWGGGGGRGGGGNVRPGDWQCPAGCGNVFASKMNCFRCGAPKPENAEVAGGDQVRAPTTARSIGRSEREPTQPQTVISPSSRPNHRVTQTKRDDFFSETVFLSLTRSPRFPRFPLSRSRQYGGGGGYERSGGSWGGGGGGWNSGGGRGYNDRPRGPTPRPGDWNCPAGCGLVFASKPNCFRCGVAKPEGADLEYGQRQDDGYQPAGGGGDWNAPRNDYPPVAPQ
jgi:hypothetical protein